MKITNTLCRDLLRQVRLLPLAALFTALPLIAQVPSLINYQGRLTDAQGQPVSGNRTMAVRIYDAASGGNMTYEESIGTVAVGNGTYTFRFGSGGAVVVSANETIATTNGTHQVFSGTIQGTPSSGTPSLSDGVYTWTASGGSSNSDAFSVTYNGTAKRFQVVYLSQVPLAGRAIVATYQTTEQETIDASLANGEAYLALSVNGTEESTRTRLLAVPYALKSADAQALAQQVGELEAQTTELGTSVQTASAALSANVTALQGQTQSVNATVSGLLAQFKVVGLSGTLAFGNSTNNGTLEISNSGFGRLAVSGISYPAGFSGDWSSGIINQGQSQFVNVTFSPAAVQSYSGNISVTSDATSGTGMISVSGEGARLIALSGDLSFGNVTVNVPSQLDFAISNTGTLDLTVSGIAYPSGFSGNWSGTILPGDSQSVTAFFTPTAVQSYGGNLSVASNATGGSGLLSLIGTGRAAGVTGSMVSVQGGTLPQSSGLSGQTVATFQIGKYEVTWGEWKEVRAWGVANGYSDLAGVGDTYPSGSADNFPVINVSWYDVVKWMNAKSEKDGLTPVYQASGAVYKTGESVPTLNSSANGYRLPTEAEWEWAARGGASSQGYTYSGSNDVDAVAWYYDNSREGTKAVGTKAANELGIHDMSGNVWEWSEDVAYTSYRRIRGGSWDPIAVFCPVAGRDNFSDSDYRYSSIGFRLARSSGN